MTRNSETPSNTYNTDQAKPLSESFDADRSTQGETRKRLSRKGRASARDALLRTPAPATRTKTTFCVYVPLSKKYQRDNLTKALKKGMWGWNDRTIQLASGLKILKSAAVGDELIFGCGGKQPRVPVGGWQNADFERAIRATITAPYFASKSKIFKNDVYQHRIRFEVESEPSGPAPFGPSINEALRLSGTKQSAAVVACADVLKLAPSADPSRVMTLDHDGPTDGYRYARFGKERAKLRRWLLRGGLDECALCGRKLPVGFIRVGHIKRRSLANSVVRRDFNNVMPVCTLGCDALFELGFVIVDATGAIQEGSPSPTPDLSTSIKGIVGRDCKSFRPESARYFEAHRQRFSNE